MNDKKSLGLVGVPERTIEHDLALLERFQSFSAELLRLALIGISAIGFVVSKALFPEEADSKALQLLLSVKLNVAVALLSFVICAAAALSHRYYAADSVSWHLQAMRRYKRNEGDDKETADKEIYSRFRRFKWSTYSIRIASVSLGLGAISAAMAIWYVLK